MKAGNDPEGSMYVPERHGLLYRLIDNLQHNPRAPGEHRFIAIGYPSAGKGNLLTFICKIMKMFGRIVDSSAEDGDRLWMYSKAEDFKRHMQRSGSCCKLMVRHAYRGAITKTCLNAMRRDWLGMQNIVWFIEISQGPWCEGCFLDRDRQLGPSVQNMPITQREREYWGNCKQRRPFGTVELPKMDVQTFTNMLIYKIQKDHGMPKCWFPSKESIPDVIQNLMDQDVVDEQDISRMGGWLVSKLVRRLRWESCDAISSANHDDKLSVDTFRDCVENEAKHMRCDMKFGRVKECLRKSNSDADRLGVL